MTQSKNDENPSSGEDVQANRVDEDSLPPAATPKTVRVHRRGRIRNRVLAGGLIAAVIALAMFFSDLFDGFGLGAGSGGGPGLGHDRRSAESQPKKSNLEKTPHQKNEEKLRDDVVEVQLYESSFQLRRTDGTVIFPPVTIEEIVRRAARAKGDARRVRVRVFIRPNAIMSRKIALREALEKSGLTGGDIVMKNLDY